MDACLVRRIWWPSRRVLLNIFGTTINAVRLIPLPWLWAPRYHCPKFLLTISSKISSNNCLDVRLRIVSGSIWRGGVYYLVKFRRSRCQMGRIRHSKALSSESFISRWIDTMCFSALCFGHNSPAGQISDASLLEVEKTFIREDVITKYLITTLHQISLLVVCSLYSGWAFVLPEWICFNSDPSPLP